MRKFSSVGLMKMAGVGDPAKEIVSTNGGSSGYDTRLLGGLGGAAIGGIAGALIDRKKRWRGALIGALGGGAAGFGLGAQHRYLQNKSQLDAQSRERARLAAAKAARIARRDAISARLAEHGITDVTPYGDTDTDIADYADRADNAIASRDNMLMNLTVEDIDLLSSNGRRVLFRAYPSIESAYSRADKITRDAIGRANAINQNTDPDKYRSAYDEFVKLNTSPLSSFVQ